MNRPATFEAVLKVHYVFFFTSVVFCLSYKLIPWGGIGLEKEYILVLHIHIQRKLPSCKRTEKVKNLFLLTYRFLLLFCCYCENGENQESKYLDSMKRKEGVTNHLGNYKWSFKNKGVRMHRNNGSEHP